MSVKIAVEACGPSNLGVSDTFLRFGVEKPDLLNLQVGETIEVPGKHSDVEDEDVVCDRCGGGGCVYCESSFFM